MNISFDDNALEELYTTGSTKERKYKKLSLDVVKQYVKTVNYINLKGVEAVWINTQYRLHFESSPDGNGIVVNALIIEISKHYE